MGIFLFATMWIATLCLWAFDWWCWWNWEIDDEVINTDIIASHQAGMINRGA